MHEDRLLQINNTTLKSYTRIKKKKLFQSRLSLCIFTLVFALIPLVTHSSQIPRRERFPSAIEPNAQLLHSSYTHCKPQCSICK